MWQKRFSSLFFLQVWSCLNQCFHFRYCSSFGYSSESKTTVSFIEWMYLSVQFSQWKASVTVFLFRIFLYCVSMNIVFSFHLGVSKLISWLACQLIKEVWCSIVSLLISWGKRLITIVRASLLTDWWFKCEFDNWLKVR